MGKGMLVDDAEKRLRAWLAAGEARAGERLPSERALAERLGVRHYALNRAMGRLIAEGRVERAGYKLSVAEGRRAPERFVCHLVISRRSENLPVYRRVAKELEIELVVHRWEAAEEAVSLLQQLDTKDIECVVCDPPSGFEQAAWVAAAGRLIRHGIPVVSVGNVAEGVSSVSENPMRGIEVAFAHLVALGHAEVAFATLPSRSPRGAEMIDEWKRLCLRNGRAASAGRVHVQAIARAGGGDPGGLAELLAGDWRSVTGVVFRAAHDCPMQSLLSELARRGRRVPEELSIVALGESKALRTASPPVSTVAVDLALLHETAFNLARREVRRRGRPGPAPTAADIQVVPRLILRESTAELGSVKPDTGAAASAAGGGGAASAPASAASAPEPSRTDEALEQAARKPYPIAARASLAERPRFQPVDLRALVNRPLNFRRGWLGDLPLRCFTPGTHEIHGVPFRILGGTSRADAGAVVFRSAVNTTGKARKLPERLIIPVNSRAEAVYILHGCGFAKFMQPFATYRFHGDAGEVAAVPLVSLGLPSPGGVVTAAAGEGDGARANIQDWWSDFPHIDFPHARMAPLRERDDDGHLRRHVYLYTLEWINPTPGALIRHVEVTVDPSVPTTLGVLAITVVTPRGAGAGKSGGAGARVRPDGR